MKNFGWLVFIDSNKEILKGKAEVVETTYLMAAIINFIIYTISEITLETHTKLSKQF